MTARKPAPTTCCVPGCDQPRHEITSRNRSRFCDAHYPTRGERIPTDAALETLHVLRPPKPQRNYPLTSSKGDVAWDEYALKCKVWHREADALVKRRGGRRRARGLTEAGRARALRRLAELSGATEGMAMKAEGAA